METVRHSVRPAVRHFLVRYDGAPAAVWPLNSDSCPGFDTTGVATASLNTESWGCDLTDARDRRSRCVRRSTVGRARPGLT